MKKIILTLILGFLLPASGFCGAADEYIVERGEAYLEAGSITDAETEFKKALMANPYNAKAAGYLEQIRRNRVKEALGEFSSLNKTKEIKKKPASPLKTSSKQRVKKSYSRTKSEKINPVQKKPAEKNTVAKKKVVRTPRIEDIKVVEPQAKPVALAEAKTSPEEASVKEAYAEQAPVAHSYKQEAKKAVVEKSVPTYPKKVVEPQAKPALAAVERILGEALAKEIPPKETYKEEAPPAHSYKQEAKRVAEEERDPTYPEEEAIPEYTELYPEEKLKEDTSIKISGKIHASFGFDSDDGFIWKRANADMNEKNWRMLASSAYNKRDDTYDPAIFDRLRFKVEKPASQGFGFGTDFDISPWSFIGKSSEIHIASADDDSADIILKYWANTNYTINETFYSNRLGNFFNVPELKVADGKIQPFSARGYDTGGGNQDVFIIPEAEIYRQFWPVREIWAGYDKEGLTLKVFPVGKESLAYNSDDPLNLSNHHIYYEESQWLVNWQPGHFNDDAGAQDFFKGWWDDSLAFMTRDSRGERLTSLRGLSLKLDTDRTLFDLTVASPKDLWQNYGYFSTYAAASRLKYFCLDNLTLGLLHGSKLGDTGSSLDVHSHFVGLDFNLGLGSNSQIFAEAVSSGGEQDKTSDYQTKKRGSAFHADLVSSSKEAFGKDYFAIEPAEWEKNKPFYKLRLSLTHMDEDFESALSSFRDTRNDTFWGRHLTFREPFEAHLPSINDTDFGWHDVKNFRIGDGIDYGRDVVSLRIETKNLPADKLDALFDIRNVHGVDGLYIENVSRLEATYKAVPKLTAKILGIYHDLPDTKAGIDPFIFNPATGDYYTNSSIEEGNDPSLKTASLGLKYDFFEWLDANFIWEHTNDCTLAYADFPRKLFEASWMSTYDEYGHTVRQKVYGLTNTDIFHKPPYPYFDIFKLGIALRPKDNLRLRVDYTRNEYNWAQIIDDNVNHIGFDIRYLPFEKLGFYFRYVYSRANDLTALNESSEITKSSHHSIFSEIQLKLKEDSELALQYGVVPSQALFASTYSPFGTASPTLDTEHIIKLYFSKKF